MDEPAHLINFLLVPDSGAARRLRRALATDDGAEQMELIDG